MKRVTKINNVEITGFSSFVIFYCNLLSNHFYIKSLCIVAAGHSVCEHCKRIQVSPTFKLKQQTFFTHIRTYTFTVPLVFNNAVSECYTIMKHSLKDRDKETP